MENSKISWTTHTFNPWRGCAKISPGCKHCYAEAQAHRYALPLWGLDAERRVTTDAYWRQPLRWNRLAQEAGERHRVFCASMADVFEVRADLAAPRARLARLIEVTPALDWLLLTKRPETMARIAREEMGWAEDWPANVWAGTSVEDQDAADERIPALMTVPASLHFLSCEPLLERIDLRRHLERGAVCECDGPRECEGGWIRCNAGWRRPQWVIVGGESGPHARPFGLNWARDIRGQCKVAGASFFMKQIGARHGTRDRAGADPAEWPEDLRVQEFPTS